MPRNETIRKVAKWIAYILVVVGAIPLFLWCLRQISQISSESRMYTYIIETPFMKFITDDRVAFLCVAFFAIGGILYLYLLRNRF